MSQHASPHAKAPITPDGTVVVRRVGLERSFGRDLYHFLRTASFTGLVASIVGFFVVTNAGFALLYLAGGDVIQNARPGSFWDAFFFSVQTMATIGYGTMTPVGLWANLLTTVEAVFGIVLTAMSTGILFAKFSTPLPRVLFSERAVVVEENGVPTLMFRMGNERASHLIVEAEIRVTFIRDVPSKAGTITRQLTDLALKRSHTPFFALTWTAMHVIDEKSPLSGLTAEELIRDNAAVLVTFTGIDDTLATSVHARHAYPADQIVFGRRFADVLLLDEHGERYVDYRRFHALAEHD